MYRKNVKKDAAEYKTNDTNHVGMSQIPPLVTYRQISKVKLNEEQAKSIKDRLVLDSKVYAAYSMRTTKEDYYLHYDYNPLSIDYEKPPPEEITKKDDAFQVEYEQILMEERAKTLKVPIKKINLLDHIHNNQLKQPPIKTKLDSKKLKEMGQYIKIPKEQPETRVDQSQAQKMVDIFASEIQNEVDFENIMKMKDENFFEKNRKIDNIFRLVFGRDNEIKTNMDILDEVYFCNDSMKETSKKSNFAIYRDISQFSRKCARNIHIKEPKMGILMNNEVNLGGYSFHTLLGIASGRLTPEDIRIILSKGNAFSVKSDDQSSEVAEQEQILYQDGTQNRAINFTSKDSQVAEQEQFIRYPHSDKQLRKQEELNQLYLQMRERRDNVQYMIAMNIKDTKTLDKLEQAKQAKLFQMINYNIKSNKSKDQQMRINKMFKTREESIKIKALTKALKMQKQHVKEMKVATKKKKTKGKSKIKSDE